MSQKSHTHEHCHHCQQVLDWVYPLHALERGSTTPHCVKLPVSLDHMIFGQCFILWIHSLKCEIDLWHVLYNWWHDLGALHGLNVKQRTNWDILLIGWFHVILLSVVLAIHLCISESPRKLAAWRLRFHTHQKSFLDWPVFELWYIISHNLHFCCTQYLLKHHVGLCMFCKTAHLDSKPESYV